MSTCFVDANILIYAYDADSGDKQQYARQVLERLWEHRNGALSIQVLQEFYVTATKKLAKPITPRQAREIIQIYEAWEVYSPRTGDISAASELAERYQLSFWDAMVVVAAKFSGADTLFTEDLQNGQVIEGVKLVNPLLG